MICLFIIYLAPSTQIVLQLEWDSTVAKQHKHLLNTSLQAALCRSTRYHILTVLYHVCKQWNKSLLIAALEEISVFISSWRSDEMFIIRR